MSGGEHTPGPWVVEDPMDHELWIVEAGKQAYEWKVIAGCPWPSEKGDYGRKRVEANAHLIAAAPDLFDAANRLLTVFAQQRMTTAERIIVGISDAGLKTEGNAAIEALSAAIAKARGTA